MEFILEILVEFAAWIGAEYLCQYTGALLLCLYHHNSTLNFTHFLYKKDEEKASKTGRIGCVFYIFVIIICLIVWNI
jgi:hypothetical protein